MTVNKRMTRRRRCHHSFGADDGGDGLRRSSSLGAPRCTNKAVGTSLNEYNVCYAPLGRYRNWTPKALNLLVPHWLPIAQLDDQPTLDEPTSSLPSATLCNMDDGMNSWESYNDTSSWRNIPGGSVTRSTWIRTTPIHYDNHATG